VGRWTGLVASKAYCLAVGAVAAIGVGAFALRVGILTWSTGQSGAVSILNSTRLTEADRASPYGLPGIGVSAAPHSDAPENVQQFHSLWIAAAQVWFCKLSARWTGAVVQRLGGENTPRRSFVQ
jgi:hypothetical protein